MAVELRGQYISQDEPADGIVHSADLLVPVARDAVQRRAVARGEVLVVLVPVLVVAADPRPVEHFAGTAECSCHRSESVVIGHDPVDIELLLVARAASQLFDSSQSSGGASVGAELVPHGLIALARPRKSEELPALGAEEPPLRRGAPRDERLVPCSIGQEEPVVPANFPCDAGDDELCSLEGAVAGMAVRGIRHHHELAELWLACQRYVRRPVFVCTEGCPPPAGWQFFRVDADLDEIGRPDVSHEIS